MTLTLFLSNSIAFINSSIRIAEENLVFEYLYVQSDTYSSSLRERLRTHKVFTKDQCFYLSYHKLSTKSYVLDVYNNRLGEAILTHVHNI